MGPSKAFVQPRGIPSADLSLEFELEDGVFIIDKTGRFNALPSTLDASSVSSLPSSALAAAGRTELTATHKACLEICELMGASSGSTLMSFATKKVHGLAG